MRGRVVLNLQLILGLFVAALLLSLTGCANNQAAAQTANTSGRWTEGHFDQLVTAHDHTPLVSRQNDCRAQFNAPASQQWALVHVRRVPGYLYRVVPVPEIQQALIKGQKVWINASLCQVRTSATI